MSGQVANVAATRAASAPGCERDHNRAHLGRGQGGNAAGGTSRPLQQQRLHLANVLPFGPRTPRLPLQTHPFPGHIELDGSPRRSP